MKSVALAPLSAESATFCTDSAGPTFIETSCWPAPDRFRTMELPDRDAISAPVTTGVPALLLICTVTCPSPTGEKLREDPLPEVDSRWLRDGSPVTCVTSSVAGPRLIV